MLMFCGLWSFAISVPARCPGFRLKASHVGIFWLLIFFEYFLVMTEGCKIPFGTLN